MLTISKGLHHVSLERPRTSQSYHEWANGAVRGVFLGYVNGTFMLLPQIGAAVTVDVTVTGRPLVSALIDTRGLFRLPPRPFTGGAGSGLFLRVAGSLLIQLY